MILFPASSQRLVEGHEIGGDHLIRLLKFVVRHQQGAFGIKRIQECGPPCRPI